MYLKKNIIKLDDKWLHILQNGITYSNFFSIGNSHERSLAATAVPDGIFEINFWLGT